MNKEQFLDLLQSHDWFYMMTEDFKVYNAGHREAQVIKEAMESNSELEEVYAQFTADKGIR